jgi:hypothetical protein
MTDGVRPLSTGLEVRDVELEQLAECRWPGALLRFPRRFGLQITEQLALGMAASSLVRQTLARRRPWNAARASQTFCAPSMIVWQMAISCSPFYLIGCR